MSELSKLNKRVESAVAFFDTHKKTQLQNQREIVKKAREWLNGVDEEMLPTADKLIGKTKEKDPVTGASRYGPNHVAKISALYDKIVALRKGLSILLEGYGDGDGGDEDEDDEKMKASEPAADAIYTDFDKNQSVFTSALGYTDSSRLQKNVATTMQRQDELRLLADSLDPMAQVKTDLRLSTQSVNGDTVGVDRFILTAHRLRADCETNIAQYSHVHLQTCLKFIQSVLVNICSHPDDEKLRRIRLQHPVVYSKLTQIHGGLSLLTACGFVVRCERSEEEAAEREAQVALSAAATTTTANTCTRAKDEGSTDATLGVHASLGKLPMDTDVSKLLICAHQLDLPVNAVLLEPNVEDIPKWMEWFDSLTALREACNKEVSK